LHDINNNIETYTKPCYYNGGTNTNLKLYADSLGFVLSNCDKFNTLAYVRPNCNKFNTLAYVRPNYNQFNPLAYVRSNFNPKLYANK
jgi:hypothetical protein